MWKKIPVQHTKKLPTGAISVRKGCDRILFGAATVRAWGLEQYKSANMLRDDTSGLAGIQMRNDLIGDVIIKRQDGAIVLPCRSFLKELGVKSGHYIAHRDVSGFCTIDFNNPATDDWIEKKKLARKYYD